MFGEILRQPGARLRIAVAIQEVSVPVHQAHLELHRAQTGGRFAREQSAADHHDGLLQVRHFAEGERVPDRPQINYVAQVYTRHRRPHRTASHRKTRLVEFDAFAIPEHSQAPVDVELFDDRAEARLDLMRMVPAWIEEGQFLDRRSFFAQKILRKYPAFVGRHDLRADNRDRAAFVVLANPFARARAADSAANNEVVALYHQENRR